MRESTHGGSTASKHDVVICGGGLAGLLLARQIRRELPDLGVTILERSRRPLPDACHKVGESSVELGSQYLEKLGLTDYLLERHLIKLGLRFFPGGGQLPIAERTEIGPFAEPIVRSYQIDRGRFEEDLRGFDEEDGINLIEGARVREVRLAEGEAPHTVIYTRDDVEQQLTARWVVDASGRSALIRRSLKLTRGARHAASSGWFRIEGRLDINDLVPESDEAWHRRPCAEERWRSTNHFMGDGYWVWVIPLSTGNTSIGAVVHEEVHDFSEVSTIDKVREFIRRHEPHLGAALESTEVLDFLCLKNYSHTVARAWSADRWAIVGEAGAFVDPLYSPGTDFIAFANCYTTEMLRTDLDGGDLKERAGMFNAQYRAFVSGALDLFQRAAPVYGHAPAMATKIYWDNLAYWSFTCQYFQQDIWRLPVAEHRPYNQVGMEFVELSGRMQLLFRTWAQLAPTDPEPIMRALPAFPSILVDAHIQVGEKMTPEKTLETMRMRLGQAREIAGELVLRIVQEIGPELAAELLDTAQFAAWQIPIAGERIEAESLIGRVRRKQLSPIARDVERSLGQLNRHPEAARARELLLRQQGSPA